MFLPQGSQHSLPDSSLREAESNLRCDWIKVGLVTQRAYGCSSSDIVEDIFKGGRRLLAPSEDQLSIVERPEHLASSALVISESSLDKFTGTERTFQYSHASKCRYCVVRNLSSNVS